MRCLFLVDSGVLENHLSVACDFDIILGTRQCLRNGPRPGKGLVVKDASEEEVLVAALVCDGAAVEDDDGVEAGEKLSWGKRVRPFDRDVSIERGYILECVTNTIADFSLDRIPFSENTAEKMCVRDLRSSPLKMSSNRSRSGLL